MKVIPNEPVCKNECGECCVTNVPLIEIEGTDGDGYQTLTLICRDCLVKALGLLPQEQ